MKETSSNPEQSLQNKLLQIAGGYRLSCALQTAAELGIADLLKEAPKTHEDLARLTSTHAPSLYRLLRALASESIFQETEDGLFENSELSELLCIDNSDSVRDGVIYIPNDGSMRAWMKFTDVVKTGDPSFKDATGYTSWEYRQHHPEKRTHFNRHMTACTVSITKLILENYNFSDFTSVIDIGGGQGAFVSSIVNAYPKLKGAVLEKDFVARQAKEYLDSQGLSERIEVIEGDAFNDIPAGYDAYMMKYVLHNWTDADVHKILCKCREVIPKQGKLIVFDMVMLPGNTHDYGKWIDLHMLVAMGGKERTENEFRELLSRAGFELIKATPLQDIGIIEAVPV